MPTAWCGDVSSPQEDYRRITVEKKGEVNFFTSQMIQDCMRKVITVNLHQTIKVSRSVVKNPLRILTMCSGEIPHH